MKDYFGTEVKVGSSVLWVGGKTKYAGVKGNIFTVIKINPKSVTVFYPEGVLNRKSRVVAQENIVVVDSLVTKFEK